MLKTGPYFFLPHDCLFNDYYLRTCNSPIGGILISPYKVSLAYGGSNFMVQFLFQMFSTQRGDYTVRRRRSSIEWCHVKQEEEEECLKKVLLCAMDGMEIFIAYL